MDAETRTDGRLGVVTCGRCGTPQRLVHCGDCDGYYCDPHFLPHVLTPAHQKGRRTDRDKGGESLSSLALVREKRGLPFLKRGMRVMVNGQMGRITSAYGLNLMVRFDGLDFSQNCHPEWKTVYYADDGTVLADFREGGHTL